MDERTRQNVIRTLLAEPTLTVLTADGLKPDSVDLHRVDMPPLAQTEEECGADYNAALQRYYDTGTEEDHEAVLNAFGLMLIVARRERRHIDRI